MMKNNYYARLLFCTKAILVTVLSVICLSGNLKAQTVLLSPTGDGGFETGTTFAANGWTTTITGNNKWYVGTVAVSAGARGVYVDKNATLGTTNSYNMNQANVQHFWRDITIPAGATAVTLTFKWKGQGENSTGADQYDFLRVYVVPTSTTPVSGTLLPAGNIVCSPGKLNLQASYIIQTINLTSFAGTTQRLVFTWANDASLGTDPPAGVDEISIVYTPAGGACVTPPNSPTALNFSAITSTSATISFTAASGADGYLIVSSPTTLSANPVDGTTYAAGNTIGNGTVLQASSLTSVSPAALTGNTSYTITVFSMNNACTGGPKYKTTTPLAGSFITCPATPGSPAISNLASTSFTLSWTTSIGGGAAAVSYTIDISTNNTFTLPIAGSPFTVNNPTVSLNVSGLTPSTQYFYRIRANGSCNSAFTTTASVTTPCNSITTVPYTQGFDVAGTTPPACWSLALVASTQNWTFAATDGDAIFTPHTGAAMAVKNWNSAASQALLISPPFNLNAQPSQGVRVNVWIYRNVNGVNNDRVRFYVNTAPNTSGATTIIDVRPLITSVPVVPSAGWYNYTGDVPLSFNVASAFYIIAEGTTTASGSSYSVGFDDFVLENIPACVTTPVASLNSITPTSASIAFTCASCAGTYVVEYGAPGFTPGTGSTPGVGGTIVTGASSPISIGPLTANTSYSVYVRNNCSGSSFSSNSGVLNITTPCNATTVPYTQNFDGVTAPAIPACWTITDNNADNTKWLTYAFPPAGGSSPNALTYQYNVSNAADDWAFSQGLTLTAGTNYQLTFKYACISASFPERLEVKWGNSPSAGGMTGGTLFSNLNIINTTYNTVTVYFAPISSGDYYLGFHCISLADEDYLFVDDVSVAPGPACIPPSGVSAAGITTTGANITFTSPANSFIVEYGLPGFTPGTGASAGAGGTVVTGSASPIAISGLNPGTSYDVYVRTNCTGSGNGYSSNSTVHNFTTQCAITTSLPYNQGFDILDVIPACWTTGLVTGTTNWGSNAADGDNQFTPHSGAGMATKDWDGAASDALLFSQPFNTSAVPSVQNRVNVWIHRNDLGVNGDRIRFWANTTPSVTGATLLIDVRCLITSAPAVPTSGWYNYIANIPLSFNSANFYIIAEGNTTANISSYSVGFDDFMVEKLVCIASPTAPVNASSACPAGGSTTLSWPAFGGATGYDVYFGTTNPATTLVSSNQAGTAYNAGTLAAGNTYYWSVVPVGPGATSCTTWSFTIKAVPDPLASSNSPVCAGQSLTLFGNNNAVGQGSGNSWSWSGPSFSSSSQNPTISGATASNAGTYTLTVTNSLGCTASSSHTVAVNPNPVLSIATQNNVSCNGLSDGDVDLDASNGTPDYLYDLDGNNTLDGIYTGLAAGTYPASVIDDNGCETTGLSVIITEPPVLTVSSGSNSPVCTGSAINLTSTPGGGTSGYNYAWTGPNGAVPAVQNPSITPATLADDGQYDLQVTDAHGCTATSSITVSVSPEATVSAGTNQGICAGSTATMAGSFGGGASSAAWSSSGSGSFNNNNPNAVYTPSGADVTAGSVLLTYTTDDPPGPCSSVNASMTLTISPDVTVSAGSNQTICSGTTATMAGSFGGAASSATWSSSGTGSFNNNNPNAVYTPSGADITAGSVILTYTTDDPDGPCSPGNASMTLTIIAAPTAAISNFGNNNICLSQPATVTLAFTGTGPWNYTISDGSQVVNGTSSTTPVNVNITPTTQGAHNYTITAVSDVNCPAGGTSTGTAAVFVSTAPPTNNVGTPAAPLEACNGTVSLVTVNTVNGQNIRYSWNTGTNAGVVLFSTNIGGPFSPGPFQTSTNQVYAQYGALAGSSGYNVCVQGVNGCGSTNNKCVWVRGIVSVPGTITPANPVACPNDVKSYTCGSSGGASVYSWTLSGSSTPITSGQGTTNVQVTFPAAFTSGQLCVTAALACGGSSTSAPRCMTITNNPATPGAFTAGPAKVCPGATGVVFTVPAVTGATGYNWTTPAGTTIASGQNTPSITVNFPNPYTGAPPVCVSATSACGTSAARCKAVGSNIPGQPGSVTGPTTNICNSTVQYSISNVAGASTYNWTNPAGTTITSGQGSTTILLSVGSAFNSGQLTVIANTLLCTPGSSIPRTITINGKPNVPAGITANPASWCNGGFVNFSAPIVTPAVNYNWAITQGTITAGQGTDNIDVTWGTGTGNVTVNATNTCGASSNRVQTFSSVCREESFSYTQDDLYSVYPNPAHDEITINVNVKETTDISVQLMDMSGRVVLTQNEILSTGLNLINLSLVQLSKGIYMLEVKSTADNWKAKIIVE